MDEIAERLGVSEDTVYDYVNNLSEEELQAMVHSRAEARAIAAEELKEQLQEVGRKKRTSETDRKIYTDDDGNLVTETVYRDQEGNVFSEDEVDSDRPDIKKKVYKVEQGIELEPDMEARYYARGEAREILSMLLDLTGGWEPIEIEKETTVSLDDDTDLDQLV
jgi:AcrR family transcriptional regulator